MKVKVLEDFIDKNSKVLYRINQEIEVNEERFKEINSTRHGILVKATEEKTKTNKKNSKK